MLKLATYPMQSFTRNHSATFKRIGAAYDYFFCHNCQQKRYCQVTNTATSKKWEIVRPGVVSPLRHLPDSIPRPPYVPNKKGNLFARNGDGRPTQPEVKSAQQISFMRESCSRARDILMEAGGAVKPGVTTDKIDEIVHNACIKAGGYPSPLQYKGFPKSVCTSVNNVVCHGIPDDRELCNGDIINIDVTIFYNGYHGDTSATFHVGEVDATGQKLLDVTMQCRDAAIAKCGPGVHFMEIGRIIQNLAEQQNFKVVPFFCGHGIGEYFHGPPSILHIENDEPGVMKTGMTFTIEPILSEGDDNICIYDDGWTALSLDDSRSAQFEHTILITDHGVDVLTS